MPTSWDQYLEQRQADIIEINTHLYELDEKERSNLSGIASKMMASIPLNSEKTSAALIQLIEMRGEVISKYAGGKMLSEDDIAEIKALPEIQKYNADIASLENSLSDAATINGYCESLVGPDRSKEAHSEWTERLLRSKGSIVNDNLIATYQSPDLKKMAAEHMAHMAAGSDRVKMKSVPRQPRPSVRRSPAPSEKPIEQKKEVPRRAPRVPVEHEKSPNAVNPTKQVEPKKSVEKQSTKEPKTAKRNTAKPVPLDEWEQYVRDFIKQYGCTPEQSNSALSILAELKTRAERLNRANSRKIETAEKISDRNQRESRLADINAPIARLFDQLKRRLDGLLTTEQRAMKPAIPEKKKRR